MLEIKNATITRTMLGVEDHGIFTFMLTLDYGGSGQGAGGYALDEFVGDKGGGRGRRVGTAYGMDLIIAVLKVVGVEKWEDLKGEHIRVKAEHSKVHAIGHFLNDEWLDFKEFYEAREKIPA